MSRTQAGVASAGIHCGEYGTGQLHLYAPTLAAGAWVRAWWQSSTDRQHWGNYLAGATLGATGVRVIASVGGIGNFARARWTQSGTAVAFSVLFVMKE